MVNWFYNRSRFHRLRGRGRSRLWCRSMIDRLGRFLRLFNFLLRLVSHRPLSNKVINRPFSCGSYWSLFLYDYLFLFPNPMLPNVVLPLSYWGVSNRFISWICV